MDETLRNFLRSFRRVHKKYLGGYVAVCEFAINLKRVTPDFISSLVAKHSDMNMSQVPYFPLAQLLHDFASCSCGFLRNSTGSVGPRRKPPGFSGRGRMARSSTPCTS